MSKYEFCPNCSSKEVLVKDILEEIQICNARIRYYVSRKDELFELTDLLRSVDPTDLCIEVLRNSHKISKYGF